MKVMLFLDLAAFIKLTFWKIIQTYFQIKTYSPNESKIIPSQQIALISLIRNNGFPHVDYKNAYISFMFGTFS